MPDYPEFFVGSCAIRVTDFTGTLELVSFDIRVTRERERENAVNTVQYSDRRQSVISSRLFADGDLNEDVSLTAR